ncbi:hypothetical protein CKAH01_17133 [Colletotrichum kahawae]|uniref:Uncharacterized protein n=1 Tax=Colletotrichum kahawae TaxID=34407 RepID=A0AAD9YF47_COLKA|nr:hypothetical protein CKAH01_17133 [Colletotrichum kahawae]
MASKENADLFYPFYSYAVGNLTPSDITLPENPTISTLPFLYAIVQFLTYAGNLTSNCDLAMSWYKSCRLWSTEDPSFGYGNQTLNIDFLRLAAPDLLLDMTSSQEEIWYNLMANTTGNDVGDAVLNITRPPIELYCGSQELLAEVQLPPVERDCGKSLQNWYYPGYEMVDEVTAIMTASSSLPTQYHNISIQTFWGWYISQKSPSVKEIHEQKMECFQSVCASLNSSGNPDVAGIGMFVSYIIEAMLATLFILETCWHNYQSRKPPSEIGPPTEDLARGTFYVARKAFLDNGVVFVLSLIVALLAVGSHETIVYNGLVTQLACYFSASAVIAVAAVPRRGESDSGTLWVVLMVCILLLTIASSISGQYDTAALNGPHIIQDTEAPMTAGFADILLSGVPFLQYSIGMASFLSSLEFNVRSQPFTVSSCLLWSVFISPITKFQENFTFATFYLILIGYLIGPLCFFICTKPQRVRSFVFRSRWLAKNCNSILFWARIMFSLFAWLSMCMGLICLALWRHFQMIAMGSYYPESDVGYGQVLALFLWTPVFVSLLKIIAREVPQSKSIIHRCQCCWLATNICLDRLVPETFDCFKLESF